MEKIKINKIFLIFTISVIVIVCKSQLAISQVLQNSGTNNLLRSICFVDKKNGFAVGWNSTILKTIDGGDNWEKCTSMSETENRYESVVFTNDSCGWIGGKDNVSMGSILLETSDGGVNWQRVNFGDGNGSFLRGIQFVNDSTGWLLELNGRIWKTSNAGETWSVQYESTADIFTKFHFLNEKTGWAIGHESVYKSIDGGESWEMVVEEFVDGFALGTLFFINDSVGYVSSMDGIHKTEDGGKTWMTNRTNYKYGWTPSGIKFISRDIGVISTTYNNGSLYTTNDGGSNYSFYYSPEGFIGGMFLLDVDNCWAVGSNGMILKFSLDTTTVGVNQNKNRIIPEKINLLQNYPNPFNPSTTIEFRILNPGKTVLKIYDVLGNEVETLVNDYYHPGKYKINWIPQNIQQSNGVYIVVLQHSDLIVTSKLIIMK